jgi:hypothetical protein
MSMRAFSAALLLSVAWLAGERSTLLAQREGTYQWHDSSEYCRVIVNATQGIETRPREWFAQDRLVTDFEITNADVLGLAEAQKQYAATRRLLDSYGLVVGTYISGTAVMPEREQTRWPLGRVPIERMPVSARYKGAWPDMPHGNVIDVSDQKTRHALQKEIQRLWKQVPAAVRFVDNAAIHNSAGTGQDWSAYCANIREIRTMGAALGSRQIFNISVHVGFMSDEETRQLMNAVADHGIALEMPWHRNIRNNKGQTEKARIRYRQLLDSGMGVIMMPLDGDPQELVDWVRTWRKPTDHIYISGAFYKRPEMQFFGPGL